MRELLQKLNAALDAGHPLACTRLVETRGSTPQKAGAMMLVYPDGTQAGTLGGGCVEAEVKRKALAVLAEGEPQIENFQLDNDYGWDDGLICGGRMQILIEPLSSTAGPYFRELAERIDRAEGVTEAVVFDAEAAGVPATASFLFDAQGKPLVFSRGDEEQAAAVAERLKPLAERPRPYASTGVGFLPTLPRCRLIIVGGGHVGKAVAELAVQLDFDVWIVDDRAEYASPERFPGVEKCVSGPMDDVLPALDVTPDTYCLIITRGHNHDQEALFHLIDRGARYVGLIGSRRKIKLIFDNLQDEGISAESLQKVYAPLGVDIGSQTVPEIAVSIAAELVAHRNRSGVVPGRPRSVEVAQAGQ